MWSEPIAVIGLGLRLPTSDCPATLWRMLCDGIDATGAIPAGRWPLESLFDAAPDRPGTIRNRRAGLIDGVDQADPTAFRLSKRELRQMDPQHRLLFECAWHALEDAGLPFDAVKGSRTGVFMGVNFSDFQRMVARDWAALDGYSVLGTTASFAANRLSYAFDFRGPSTVSSVGCASSTVALHEACRSLVLGEVEMALAGGVELMLSPDSSIMLSQAGVFSERGQCRTLDAQADGYVRGEGAGVVVLKPLSKVLPGDRVYAVIRGSAVNHNGRNEWIMAPSASAQADVIRQACAQGGVAPESVDYIELHGSAFLKGDAAEAEAIGEALGPQRPLPCRLGAISNNVGYLGAAAGIAQFIKVCLSLHHRTLPPTIHVDAPNPLIDLERLGLSIQTALEPWAARAPGEPLRAGIVSTSLGGANGFVVLEEAPAASPVASERAPVPGHLLVLSALSLDALRQRALQLRDFVATTPDAVATLEDLCFTAALKRQHHRYRGAVVAADRDGLVALLGELAQATGATVLAQDDMPRDWVEAGRAFVAGGVLPPELFPSRGGRCVSLPVYPFQRQRLWPDWLTPDEVCRPPKAAPRDAATLLQAAAVAAGDASGVPEVHGELQMRAFLRGHLAEVLEVEPATLDVQGRTFFELGLNSIGATQLKERIARALQLPLSTTLFFELPRLEPLAKRLVSLLEARHGRGSSVSDGASASTEEEEGLVERIAGLSEDEAREQIARTLAELSIEVA
ncbi:beta-ketoacyl synthase N-terminal-like domain-containing protein [Corallococcus macrosporus]|uniref:beta-ketoacyl synthase N-terminal-like domain-containing protein n=1 Tax=Corallococcus macrosporus TaxID=35 RepID=UPI0009E18F09|nr:beta-ketoacyl synthase N-terminal-like domain-containing protein [Corallococcus macrosporus]